MEDPTETVPLHGGQPRPGSVPGAEALERGTAVGRYMILDRIGSGGMGVVYAAWDPELERRIALKLLRPERLGSGPDRPRLLREAQAMARLTHPNVVAVHDAGTFGDRVFVAMELVEGRTLRQWLAEASRSRREILETFLAAGRGLAAAHAAGLVHRDFKPENVLIGKDGRARVVDFGLARESGEAEGEEWGVVQGTPAYMAPEQLRGIATDVRSDQFSFCVAVYEALYGERPFAGKGPREIAEAVLRGEVRPEPAGTKVPGRLRQVLLRGLKARPEDRYPSMNDLLRDLEHDPEAVRRRWLLAAAVVLGMGALFSSFGYFQARRARLCGGAEERLAGVWDASRKREVRAAFLATRLPFAEGAWKSVERGLDRYAQGWGTMYRQACEATRIRGEQSEDLMDRRMFCLGQRLDEAGALTASFARADAQTVQRAVQAVGELEPLSRCADFQALKARVPPPADAGARARVVALQKELARVQALRAAGKYSEALDLAQAVSLHARGVGYGPLQAEILYVDGDLRERVGQFEAAERTLRQAVTTAEAAAADEVKARAAIALLFVVGDDLARFDRGHEWGHLAAATLQRLGKSDDLRAELANDLGSVYEAEGKYPEALRSYQEAVDLRRAIAGDQDPRVAASIANTGVPFYRMGRYAEAQARFEQALEIQKRVLGPQHPEVADSLNRVGGSLYEQDRYPEAEKCFRQALEIREAVFAPDHRLVVDSLQNLAGVLDDMGRPEEALPYYRRVLELRRQVFGPAHPDVAEALANLGVTYVHLARWKEAMALLGEALGMREKTLGPDHPKTAQTLHDLGEALEKQGRLAEALSCFQRSLRIREKALGPSSPLVAKDLASIAGLERRLGRQGRTP
jgi:tetratricopeptide (TPR) repeat protein/predicted Ser/Thr protein kinase